MTFVDPALVFKGRILVMVPHMDDGVLGCGGTLAMLPDKERVHVVYATDGKASPAPVLPWMGAVPGDLELVRMGEARAAMGSLGVPEANIHFLRFPDGKLRAHLGPLQDRVKSMIEHIRPDRVFVPFRYDSHTDHLALHRAVTGLLGPGSQVKECHEYFVYYRLRLVPGGDVRKHIEPRLLSEVDTSAVWKEKRAALALFRSQTTIYCPWQRRPNLSARLLDETSRSPEVFLAHNPLFPGSAIFERYGAWVRIAHALEPRMKKRKDQAAALLRLVIDRDGGSGNR